MITNGTKNLMYMFDCSLSEIIVYATHIPKLFRTYICKYKRLKKFTETIKKIPKLSSFKCPCYRVMLKNVTKTTRSNYGLYARLDCGIDE